MPLPLSTRLTLALAVVATVLAAGAAAIGDALLPAYRWQVARLLPEYRIVAIERTVDGRDTVVRLTVTLARAVPTARGLVLPDDRGRATASTLAAAPLTALALAAALLLGWPAATWRERLARGMLGALLLGALALADVPVTLAARVAEWVEPGSPLVAWAGFMQRGGRFALALAGAAAAIALAARFARAPLGGTAAAGAVLIALAGPGDVLAIVAGAPPDSPAARVDANTTTSPWAGVGSVRVNGGVFSGALIGRRYVLTAAHVVAGAAPSAIRFNLNFGGSLSHDIGAVARHVHPDYTGFSATNPNNDLAIVELETEVPAGVPVYGLRRTALTAGTTLWLVGYGASGTGDVGTTVAASAAVKRVGRNRADAFRADDAASGAQEVYYFDFDGGGVTNFLGGTSLGNAVEATLAGGDSGSPAFVQDGATWILAGVNTFVGFFNGGPTVAGTFGTAGGGQSVAAYAPWIDATIAAAEARHAADADIPTLPEWGALALATLLVTTLLRRRGG